MSAVAAAVGGGSKKSPFVPLVNRISAFHTNTPDRYKSQIRLEAEGGAAAAASVRKSAVAKSLC